MANKNLKALRIIAFVEGISYLLLMCISMPLKYLYDMADFSFVVGLIHGCLYCLYVFYVFLVTLQLKWSFKKSFLAQIAGLLPFGTFWADKKLFRVQEVATENS